MKRPRLTIPTRIFLAFASVLAAFGVVAGASLVQHQHTAETLRLLDEAYVPLVLAIGDAKASQAVVTTMLDQILDERSPQLAQGWMRPYRRLVPQRLTQANRALDRVSMLNPTEADRAALVELRAMLRAIESDYDEAEPLYNDLFAALDRGDRAQAGQVHANIVRREGQIARQFLVLRSRIQSQIEETSRIAADQERRSVVEIAMLALLALAAGLGVMWWSQRLLAPLPLLHQRVVAVARGDLATHLEVHRDDEIARLATEFERMVAAIATRDETLRELQRLQERIVASLRSAVLVIDGDGQVRAANHAADAVLGIDREAIQRPLVETGLFEKLSWLEEAIERVAHDGDPVTMEAAQLGSDARHVDVLIAPFGAAPKNALRSVLIVADDVTDKLATKARLIQSERLAAMGKMAAHVTHEVRNPLSSIALNVEVLAEELNDAKPELQAPLRSIQREIDRLTGITEEYLRLARLPAPRREAEDLGAVVAEIARFVEREIIAAGSTIELSIEPHLPLIAADEAQIRQALLNLLRNARESMPRGGKIVLSASEVPGGIEIAVRDHGEGIPAARRANLFDLFYSTKEGGTGLGLPLTQQIVVAHGGLLRCEDADGGGTVFVMFFPRSDDRSNPPAEDGVVTGRQELG